jgi:hypothetical protein
MPQSGFDPSLAKVIQRPPCPQCGTDMMLSRIEPSTPGVDQRTFECKCGYSEILLVKYD